MPRVPWTLRDFFSVVLAGVLVAVIASLFVDLDAESNAELTVLLLIPAEYIGEILALMWVMRRRVASWVEHLSFEIEPRDIRFLGVGLGLQFALVLLFIPFYEALGLDESGQSIVTLASELEAPLVIAVLAVTAAVIAPVIEELMFRGMLLRWLVDRVSTRAAIVWSSAAFSAAHTLSVDLTDPLWLRQLAVLLPQVFLLALPLAWLTLKHRRLGPAIFTHAGFNLWLVIALSFPNTLSGS